MEANIKIQAGFKSSTLNYFSKLNKFILVRNYPYEVWNFTCSTIEHHKGVLDIGVWKIKQLKQ
jgi:hypothetical protein